MRAFFGGWVEIPQEYIAVVRVGIDIALGRLRAVARHEGDRPQNSTPKASLR